jgi:hypothetical protein
LIGDIFIHGSGFFRVKGVEPLLIRAGGWEAAKIPLWEVLFKFGEGIFQNHNDYNSKFGRCQLQ